MTRKTTLSPESLAVIAHLRAHGCTTATDLLAQFPSESRAEPMVRPKIGKVMS